MFGSGELVLVRRVTLLLRSRVVSEQDRLGVRFRAQEVRHLFVSQRFVEAGSLSRAGCPAVSTLRPTSG